MTKTLSLLAEKQRLFDQYEKVTDRLVSESDADAMGKYITERSDLAIKIDEIDEALRQELSGWGAQGQAALSGKVEPETLPQELRPVAERCQAVMETVRSIRLKNSEAVARCEQMRDDSLQKIKESNQVPKIGRYLSSLSGEQNGNNFGSV